MPNRGRIARGDQRLRSSAIGLTCRRRLTNLELKAVAKCSDNMTNEVIPHFHNDLGVQVIEIGAKKFMCMGALPPQDHPHVFCDMGEDVEYVCPYCSTLYRHNPALAPNHARPAECEFRDIII